MFFVFVYDCTMPTTRGQLGAAGGSDHEDNSDEAPDGGEEQSPASLATVLEAIAGIQRKLNNMTPGLARWAELRLGSPRGRRSLRRAQGDL